MSKKGSYFAKHRAAQGADAPAREERTRIVISPEKRTEFEEGKVILIDKPLHWTSFDVVRKIRNSIGIKKVGHAGTLDPLATGLLIVCTGRSTKQINLHMAAVKEYTGSITLGAVTPTYDLESAPEDFKDIGSITEENIRTAAQDFVGDIEQFPPIYSAIKKQGVASYELARRGEAVDLKSRPIRIEEFEITKIDMAVISFRVRCSTGTYIRSLANDLGKALGCGGYLSSLRRTAIGDNRVEQAQRMDEFLASLGEDPLLKKDS